jgi:hypothetical protein
LARPLHPQVARDDREAERDQAARDGLAAPSVRAEFAPVSIGPVQSEPS